MFRRICFMIEALVVIRKDVIINYPKVFTLTCQSAISVNDCREHF